MRITRMSTVIGIDLGTSNSCVAYIDGNKPHVIYDEQGRSTLPSVYARTRLREPLVGYEAKAQQENNRKNTIFAVKRLIGRKFDSPEITDAVGRLPYAIVPAKNGDAWVEVGGEPMSPEEVSSHILIKVKELAEQSLQTTITQAVITVPAHFNDAQRQATKDAGRLAGLDVLRIINEPTAAALAFGLHSHDEGGFGEQVQRVAVFDLGGGTFDISILELRAGVFDVLSTHGDTFLGGEDFDLLIVQHFLSEFLAKTGVDVSNDKATLQRLKAEARRVKHELSVVSRVDVELPFVQGLDHMVVRLERKMLEQLVRPVLDRIKAPCEQALQDAKLKPEDVTQVVLVGGMTRMPAVKSVARRIFKREPLDSIDPDKAVALGAAVQAGLLQGLIKGVSLLDVTSLSLGIEIQGGKTHVLIPRNTKIPTQVDEIITTSAPNQPQVSIHVVQGEDDFAPNNKSLGRFELTGIRPAPRGIPDIELSFGITAEGIVQVAATDLESGQAQEMEIIASAGLDEGEIDDLLRTRQEELRQAARIASRRETIDVAGGEGAVDELRMELKTIVFMTQLKLDTEGKGFGGEGRSSLEAVLSIARKMLTDSDSHSDMADVIREIKECTAPLEEYLESQW